MIDPNSIDSIYQEGISKGEDKAISSFTTQELVDELQTRDGVDIHPTFPLKCKSVTFTKETWDKAYILVVKKK